MAGSLNKVILIGRLGQDPDVREVGTSKVANFSIATDESYTDRSGNKVEKTEWHRIVMWNKAAETAERYLKKGSLVYVEGKLETRSWETDSGEKRYSTEIKSFSFQMLENKSATNEIPDTMPYSKINKTEEPLAEKTEEPLAEKTEEPLAEKTEEPLAEKEEEDDLPF